MECMKENFSKMYMNIDSFSNILAQKWNVHSDFIKNYIFANVSIGLVKKDEMKDDINKLYELDRLKYYNAAAESSCIKHVIMKQGSLEQEINARKVLGMLLIAEEDYKLRNKIIKLLRKHYPSVYRSVKKFYKTELIARYIQMDEATRKIEARLDAAVYFYFAMYCSPEVVDQGYILSIINDLRGFEFASPMTANIDKELAAHKVEIEKIKAFIAKEYGNIYGYIDILNADNEEIDDLGSIIQNIFMINKIDINQIFYNSEALNIDKIILAYIKRGYTDLEPHSVLQTVVNGIFLQYIINEYKKSRELYFKDNQETLHFKLCSLEEKFNNINVENEELKLKVASFQQQMVIINETQKDQINKLNKNHKSEIIHLENKIKELDSQLLEEKKYRSELNNLREYIFEVKNEYVPSNSDKTLGYYITNSKILIIGGPKDWRRKFRDKYPEIKTLNGFNENFEINLLNNIDYIFFYTGYMNHSTYNRTINFIRTHQINFGYIGKTNIELVEKEIIEELQRDKMGRRLNLSE